MNGAPMPQLSPACLSAIVSSTVSAQRRQEKVTKSTRQDWLDLEGQPPPDLDALRSQMRTRLGSEALRLLDLKRVAPECEAGWTKELAAAADPRRVEKLEALFQTIVALEAMSPDAFHWTPLGERLPEEEVPVFYYFDLVGTHPGRFKGLDPEAGNMDVFVGEFGGFLTGDVTHWAPRPYDDVPSGA